MREMPTIETSVHLGCCCWGLGWPFEGFGWIFFRIFGVYLKKRDLGAEWQVYPKIPEIFCNGFLGIWGVHFQVVNAHFYWI